MNFFTEIADRFAWFSRREAEKKQADDAARERVARENAEYLEVYGDLPRVPTVMPDAAREG